MINFRNNWKPGWLLEKDHNGDFLKAWCSKKDEQTAACSYCRSSFNFSNRGKHSLFQHAKTAGHMKHYKNQNQTLKIAQKSNQSSLSICVNSSKRTIINEIAWTIHIILCSRSELSADADFRVLKFIAPNDLSDFKLHRTKISYFRSAIASWFKEMNFKDASLSFYTIMFDDTENNANAKELQMVLKYYSKTLRKIKFIHLETAFLGSATGTTINDALKTAISSNNLNIENCVMLGSDGPNVNKTVKKKLRLVCSDAHKQKIDGYWKLS